MIQYSRVLGAVTILQLGRPVKPGDDTERVVSRMTTRACDELIRHYAQCAMSRVPSWPEICSGWTLPGSCPAIATGR